MYVCMYVCMYACMYVYIYVSISVFKYVCMHVCMPVSCFMYVSTFFLLSKTSFFFCISALLMSMRERKTLICECARTPGKSKLMIDNSAQIKKKKKKLSTISKNFAY
jgi:hypothetical protein